MKRSSPSSDSIPIFDVSVGIPASNAADRFVFPRLSHKGKTFVEVEPDTEFYVQLYGPNRYPVRDLYAVVTIDSNVIGCTPIFSAYDPPASQTFETFTEVEGNLKHTKRLQFSKMPLSESNSRFSPSFDEIVASLGKIEVNIVEAESVYVGEDDFDDDTWEEVVERHEAKMFKVSTAGIVDSQWDGRDKKILHSNAGALVSSEPLHKSRGGRPRNEYVWETGRTLDVITLHYCSAPLLCALKVAPKRSDHDELTHRLQYYQRQRQQKPSVSPTSVARTPTEVVEHFDKSGNVVNKYDVYDFTADADDDET